MAELDNVFLTSSPTATLDSSDNEKVEIEWLDFDYINSCTDLNRLRNIYSVLISGKEGHYPQVYVFTSTIIYSLVLTVLLYNS